MKLLEWLAAWLEKRGALPTHHTRDPRLTEEDSKGKGGCYLCPQCGHAVDTRYAVRFVSEEEMAARRAKVLKMKF